MGAEQMRVELESFVNQGLQEGWCGWPMKTRLSGQEEVPDAKSLVSTVGLLFGHVRQRLVSPDQLLSFQGGSAERDIQASTSVWTGLGLFGEKTPFLCDHR